MAEFLSEVARISSQNEEQCCFSLTNLKSGLQIKNYKGGQCGAHCITNVGKDYIFTAQDKKQLIHVWDLRKEQIHMKIVCPGKITAMCCSPDGNYCVVALMEKIYIWQVPTGNLMQILSKHYQPITCLKFTDDGSHFISGGEDNLVIVWNMARALSASDEGSFRKKNQEPIHTWSHHSLPVKDIHVGSGGIRCRVATCSLDQTCKLYDMASGQLLLSLLFDTGLTSVTMDTAENHLFVGGITGRIHLINLYQKRTQREHHVESDKDAEVLSGHSKEVTSLSVNLSGTALLSGSADCTARVWHIASAQCIKQMTFKGRVTNAKIMRLPQDLVTRSVSKLRMPVSNFKRKIFEPFRSGAWDDTVREQDEVVPVILKNIDEDFLNFSKHEYDGDIELVREVIGELQRTDLDDEMTACEANKMSRSELLNRIEQLEDLTKTLYRFSANNIISGINEGEI